MDAPEDYVGYVTGWRWWLLDETSKNPHPCSIGVPYRWEWAGENTTAELTLANKQGFYAYKAASVERIRSGLPLLFGRVALYGDVVVHKHGYRAQRARILDAWCAPELWGKLSQVKQIKGTYKITNTGDTEWLTLATLTELSDTIPSDSPRIPLRSRKHL